MIRMYLKMGGIHRQPVTEKVRANIIPPYNPPWIMQNMSSKSFTLQIFVYNHSANHMTFVTEITIEWGTVSGWWFGTFFIFPYLGNFIITDELHHFSEG